MRELCRAGSPADGRPLDLISNCELMSVHASQSVRSTGLLNPFTGPWVTSMSTDRRLYGFTVASRKCADLHHCELCPTHRRPPCNVLETMSAKRRLRIGTDGACSGNQYKRTRRSGYAFVVDSDGATVHEKSGALEQGAMATNNSAEYMAIIQALEWASTNHEPSDTIIRLVSDSELALKQVSGEYATNDTRLRQLRNQVQALVAEFGDCELTHASKGENELIDRADELAKGATD